ncbi:phage tail spike protein [Salinicoccus roseus]|uniref:phage tail spike protein n=1 Tax=Salinicoccus roseus TaxID=45670 RepID=UPI003524B182
MIYLFDRQKKLQKIIPKRHLLSAIQTVELNGLYQLSVEVPLFYETKEGTQYNYKKNVEKAWFAGHYDRQKRFQLYKIHTRKVRADNKRILLFDGVHIFFDEAKAMGNIHDRRFRDYDVKPVADAAFNPIGWYVKDYDVTDTTDITFYRDSVANARSLIIEKFGVEFDYGLTFDGRKIISKDLYIKKRLGKWTGKRFAYGTNLLSLTQEQDESEVYTAAVGRGKGEESGEGYGPRVEFGDIEWSKDGITKPIGQNWIEIPSATAEYGYYENGEIHPRIAPEVIFENTENKQLLADSTYYWLLENCVPKATWKTDIARVGAHDLGDSVGVIYKQADIIKKARIHKMENNLLDDNLSKITLGDYQHFKTDRRQQSISAQLKRNRTDTQSYITQLKNEFDVRYEAQTTAIENAYEQAVIDANAETDAAEQRMSTALNEQKTTLEGQISTAKSQAITQAEQDATQKTDAVQSDLNHYKQQSDNRIQQIVGGDVSSITKSILDMNDWQDQKGVIIDDVNDAISGRVWSTDITEAIDDIELGTRNMLLGTDGETTIDQSYKRWQIADGALYDHLGEPVTLSFEAKADTNGEIIRPYFTGDGIHTIDNMELTTEWKKYSVTFTLDSESYKTVSFHTNGYGGATVFTGHVRKIKFEKGVKATDHTLAPEDLIQFTDFKVLSDGFSIGTTKVGGKEFATGIVGDAEGLSLIGDNVDVSNNLTVQNTVKAWGVEAVTGDFGNIVASTGDIQFIKNKHLATESVNADKLKVNAALVDKLVANTVFADEINTMSLNAVHADLTSVNSEIMQANIIKSEWLDVDTALFDRITSSEAFIDRLEVKAGNIRDLSATHIVGGILDSLNGETRLNLNTGNWTLSGRATIAFQDARNSLVFSSDNITTGIGFDIGSGSQRPITFVGSSDNSLTTKNDTYAGLIVSPQASQLSDRTFSSFTSRRFIIRNIMNYTKGFEFDFFNYRPTLKPLTGSSMEYALGDGESWFDSIHVQKIRVNLGNLDVRNVHDTLQGWSLNVGYSGTNFISLVGLNAGPYWNNPRYYSLGKNSNRFSQIYLLNQPNVSSDERLKKDITENHLGLDFIKDIRTINFRMEADMPENYLKYGVSAQNLLVAMKKHGVNMNDNSIVNTGEDGMYGVEYTQLIAPLIKGEQELDVRVTALEEENKVLRNEIKKLKGA